MTKLKFLSWILAVLIASAVNGQGYTITPIPYNPQSNGGTSLLGAFSGIDDGVSAAIAMGFNFCFYGQPYNQLYVGTNGWISFSPNQPITFTVSQIPTNAINIPKNCVMAPWQDWWSNFGGNGDVQYQRIGATPFRKFVVSFNAVPLFSCTENLGTFQVVFTECSNTIEVYILHKPHCEWAGGRSVLGLHDDTGTLADTIAGRNSTVWTVDSSNAEGWLFSPILLCEGASFGCTSVAPVDPATPWDVR